MKKMYVLYSMTTGEMVGIARWKSREVDLVREVYTRNNILIVEKTK